MGQGWKKAEVWVFFKTWVTDEELEGTCVRVLNDCSYLECGFFPCVGVLRGCHRLKVVFWGG